MKYDRIAGNDSINAAIYCCFECLTEADARAFVRKFTDQPHDQDQVMHTFRELILGAFLAANGLAVASERPVAAKTPDWSILDGEDLRCIVELVNFHTARATEDDIKAHFDARKLWSGWQKPHADRLYARIREKCVAYKAIAERESVSYVIGVYGDFLAAVDQEEVEACLHDQEAGLFTSYPDVSGVLFFDDSFARYRFIYLANPQARRPFALPDGVMDLSLWTRPAQ